MNGWDLYSMHDVEDDEGALLNCIFMREAKSDNPSESDIINISDFKSQMEKMLSPKMTEYEKCLDLQAKIRNRKNSKLTAGWQHAKALPSPSPFL